MKNVEDMSWERRVKKHRDKMMDRLDKLYAKNLSSPKNLQQANIELRMIDISAKIVNQFELSKRIGKSQEIRIFNLISSSPEEMKSYVEATMPIALLSKKKTRTNKKH